MRAATLCLLAAAAAVACGEAADVLYEDARWAAEYGESAGRARRLGSRPGLRLVSRPLLLPRGAHKPGASTRARRRPTMQLKLSAVGLDIAPPTPEQDSANPGADAGELAPSDGEGADFSDNELPAGLVTRCTTGADSGERAHSVTSPLPSTHSTEDHVKLSRETSAAAATTHSKAPYSGPLLHGELPRYVDDA